MKTEKPDTKMITDTLKKTLYYNYNICVDSMKIDDAPQPDFASAVNCSYQNALNLLFYHDYTLPLPFRMSGAKPLLFGHEYKSDIILQSYIYINAQNPSLRLTDMDDLSYYRKFANALQVSGLGYMIGFERPLFLNPYQDEAYMENLRNESGLTVFKEIDSMSEFLKVNKKLYYLLNPALETTIKVLLTTIKHNPYLLADETAESIETRRTDQFDKILDASKNVYSILSGSDTPSINSQCSSHSDFDTCPDVTHEERGLTQAYKAYMDKSTLKPAKQCSSYYDVYSDYYACADVTHEEKGLTQAYKAYDKAYVGKSIFKPEIEESLKLFALLMLDGKSPMHSYIDIDLPSITKENISDFYTACERRRKKILGGNEESDENLFIHDICNNYIFELLFSFKYYWKIMPNLTGSFQKLLFDISKFPCCFARGIHAQEILYLYNKKRPDFDFAHRVKNNNKYTCEKFLPALCFAFSYYIIQCPMTKITQRR